MRAVAVTGLGLVCALGEAPDVVAARLAAGDSGVRPATDHRRLLPIPGLAEARVDVTPHLSRRRDRKLLARASELAIVAARHALGDDARPDAGVFLGVGPEPTDGGDSEPALLASGRDGRFDAERFGLEAVGAYPPLASLRTLPNLALAHVAIQLGLTGPSSTRAGDTEAGLAALVAGWHCVAEGRADVVLAGGAFSGVDASAARDLVRLGEAGPLLPPGEAAALLRLEAHDAAEARGARVFGWLVDGSVSFGAPPSPPASWADRLGLCGAATGVVDVVLALARGTVGAVSRTGRGGASARVAWAASRTG